MKQEITFDNIVPLLVEEVPVLRPLLAEHLQDQFGQILQHVFFGDLTRFIVHRVRTCAADKQYDPTVMQILRFLESALLSSDERVRELVLGSFVENLDQDCRTNENFRAALGPGLRRSLESFGT